MWPTPSPRSTRREWWRSTAVAAGSCQAGSQRHLGDELVGHQHLDQADQRTDGGTQEPVEQERWYQRVIEHLGVVDGVQHTLFDLQRKSHQEDRAPERPPDELTRPPE